MKRLFCFAAILCFLFSLTGCKTDSASQDSDETVTDPLQGNETDTETETETENNTETETKTENESEENTEPEEEMKQIDLMDYINCRAALSHTYKKLTEDKELTVVYFGGSVTAGHGSSSPEKYSWRARIGKWIAESFPDAKVTNINRALGESGTYLGAYRVQTDVISAEPDLLFLEYSINDYYYKSTYEQAASQYETIIREVKAALPDTDIVTVLVTDETRMWSYNKVGMLHTQAQAHEDIAKAYNIPTLHVGRYLVAQIDYWSSMWSNYAIDGVHPNDQGYEVYYELIREYLRMSLFETDYTKPLEKFVMVPVISETLFDGDRQGILPTQSLVELSESMGGRGIAFAEESSFNNSVISDAVGQLLFDGTDDELVIRFTGTELSAYVVQKNVPWQVSVDGGEYVLLEGSAHNPVIFAKDLSSGEHVVRVRLYKDANVSMGMLFTRDATKATPKGSN